MDNAVSGSAGSNSGPFRNARPSVIVQVGGIAELRPGESEHARVGTEQQLEDGAGVVIDDGGETVGRRGVVVGEEVGFVDIDWADWRPARS